MCGAIQGDSSRGESTGGAIQGSSGPGRDAPLGGDENTEDELAADNAAEEDTLRTLDPDSRAGLPGADRKVKGTIHWVAAATAVEAEVRLYDRLFSVPDPDKDEAGKTYRDHLNPESVRIVRGWIHLNDRRLIDEPA